MADIDGDTGALMTNVGAMIEQSLTDRLVTGMGERVWNPEYGSTLGSYIGATSPSNAVVTAEVGKATRAEYPRLSVTNIVISRPNADTVRATVNGTASDVPISANVEV